MADEGRKVQFEEMFPWEISAVMAETPLCYLPLGTLEWHGEHAAVGLDALKAHAVCVRAARRSGGLVVPSLYWSTDWREDRPDGSYLTGGIERGERYHVPGSMFWLRPETFHDLLLDIYEAMRRRGSGRSWSSAATGRSSTTSRPSGRPERSFVERTRRRAGFS